MKKFVSSFLIFSTLFSSFAPVHSCFAAGKGRCQRPVERYNVRRCSAPARPIDIKDEAALKQAILELAKDKKFTDQIVKNYERAHEDPFLLKLIKLPFKVVYKIICKLFDYTIGYWIGDKICKFLEDCAFLGISLLIIKKYYISADTLDKWSKFRGDLKQKLNEYAKYLKKRFNL